jgi:3-oxoacyl-[acyl-carrier-protein] synthase-1
MNKAIEGAGIAAADIDYINLHGTATEQNDRMEARAVERLFSASTPPLASSTKPFTGHTLGAAGALEVAFCWLALQREDGRLPPHIWEGVVDPELPILQWTTPGEVDRIIKFAMSNSFAFGGNNISLVMEQG